MPKPRNKENKSLPKRWALEHNAYYYLVPKGAEAHWDGKTKFKLGRTLPEAFAEFARRIDSPRGTIRTLNDAFNRYLLQVVPTKAAASQASNHQQIKWLRKVFGEMPILPFSPKFVYQYVDKRESKTSAHREIATLSHVFTKLIEWGEIDRHPFKGQILLTGEKPRDRYVEDWEIDEFLSLKVNPKSGGAVIQAYTRLKLLTGMDKSTMLRLEPNRNFTEEGILIQRNKTKNSSGKRTLYTWTPALRTAADEAIAARPVDISPYLFCNKYGQSYVNEETGNPAGFKSLWDRYFKKVIKETKLEVRFTERDLRAKVATDADSLEHAQAMLSHSDSKTTNQIYRRKPTKVHPLR
ncbi:MAG: tyrosine-type recombinase/integrase [Methylophilaceae bacterium]